MLLVLVAVLNAARSSNLCNITLKEFNNAYDDKEYNSKVMKNANYKTSLIYGGKLIVLNKDIHTLLKQYIDYYRPKIIEDAIEDDNKRFIFNTSRKTVALQQMSQSTITMAITRSFRESNVLQEHFDENVSPTRFRIAVASQLAGMEAENIDSFATNFMKNRTGTCQKCYIKRWRAQEAIRISAKCIEVFLEKKTEMENEMTKKVNECLKKETNL